jgi:hypothetical protein
MPGNKTLDELFTCVVLAVAEAGFLFRVVSDWKLEIHDYGKRRLQSDYVDVRVGPRGAFVWEDGALYLGTFEFADPDMFEKLIKCLSNKVSRTYS